ncbi:hypothetical protein [Flavobacterium croceum]|uniref:hypothetical protein n=1 Tax=Flavobacterium croceum TaxID=370975 RepID=UPI0024A82DC3|nr:hypothetical protein [Flavobacterium croceum]
MKTIITAVAFFITSLLVAQTQFEQGMGNALKMWGEGKSAEATALLERIALAEKGSWLPNYYIGLIATTDAFQTKDKEKITALLTKAQQAVDIETAKDEKNPELMVLQAMIYTAWIVYDPMTNGMKYGAKAQAIYEKALIIAPNNPRVVFCKAEYEIGGAKFWKQDTTPMCEQVRKSIELFDSFKPESAFYPNWGKDRAEATLKTCGGK